MKVTIRKSEDRGHEKLKMVDTYYSFSFSNYYDSKFTEFGCIRVLNEDILEPNKGFSPHSHDSFNIFSYIVSGELTHKDSIGNVEVIKAGNVQFTCSGTGITHSESNLAKKNCHLLQVWLKSRKNDLKPCYKSLEFKKENKRGKLLKMLSPEDEKDVIFIESNVTVYSSILNKDEKLNHKIQKGHKVYIHLIQRKGACIDVEENILNEGDGCFIICKNSNEIQILGKGVSSEFLLFDLFE